MRELTKRVQALEALHGANDTTDVIIVDLVTPDEEPQELQTLTCGDLAWHRRDGESEDQFKSRARAEVPRAKACIPVLLMGEPA